jgi:nicotinamide riboside kinase
MKNIYVIGAQSTGKTTLVDALEECLSLDNSSRNGQSKQPYIIREVARKVLKEKGYSRVDIETSPTRALQLQQHILEAQHNAELEATAQDTSPWYISDRSGLDPIVYASIFGGAEAAETMLASEIWLEMEARMKAGVVVLCEAGCEWLIDDGTRWMPSDAEQWMRVDAAFRDMLEARGIRYDIVKKDMKGIGERVEFVRGLTPGDASRK